MSAVGIRQPMIGIAALAALVAAALLAPVALPADDPADVVTRQTARVAVLFWGVAVAAILLRRRDIGRLAWALGAIAFVIHVVTAFDRIHAWSNSAAMRHVELVSGFGPGLFVSYAFTTLWAVDATWWWIDRIGYDARSEWLDRSIQAFMAFIVFNGTVVYETGFIRWAGIALFVGVGVLFAWRLWSGWKVRPAA